jgi:hypothetical protein
MYVLAMYLPFTCSHRIGRVIARLRMDRKVTTTVVCQAVRWIGLAYGDKKKWFMAGFYGAALSALHDMPFAVYSLACCSHRVAFVVCCLLFVVHMRRQTYCTRVVVVLAWSSCITSHCNTIRSCGSTTYCS